MLWNFGAPHMGWNEPIEKFSNDFLYFLVLFGHEFFS